MSRRGIRRDDRGNLDVEEDTYGDDDRGNDQKKKLQAQKDALKNKRNKNRFAGMIARNDNKKSGSITTISVAGGKSTDIGTAAPTRSSFGFAPKNGPGGPTPSSFARPSDDSNTNGNYSGNYVNDRENNESKRVSNLEKELVAKGISPVFDPDPNRQATSTAKAMRRRASVTLDLSDLGAFLTRAVPHGLKLQCQIVRNRKGLKGKVFPSYDCYYGTGPDRRLLCCASKRSKNKTSNYIISMSHGVNKNVPSYLGKLRSNFVGTEFTLFDKGVNPKKSDRDQPIVSRATIRQELGFLIYESNLLGNRGPRKMVCCVPEVSGDGDPLDGFHEPGNTEEGSSLQKIKNGTEEGMVVLKNKDPSKDERGNFSLDFGGRVTMASIKNFQLCENPSDPASPVILQFGRCDKEEFSMDVTFPLSPLQAFGFCLASFDNKLALD